jgi:hypothetical protein
MLRIRFWLVAVLIVRRTGAGGCVRVMVNRSLSVKFC